MQEPSDRHRQSSRHHHTQLCSSLLFGLWQETVAIYMFFYISERNRTVVVE
jgi:hypothetical protein